MTGQSPSEFISQLPLLVKSLSGSATRKTNTHIFLPNKQLGDRVGKICSRQEKGMDTMGKLNAEIKEFLSQGRLAYVATCDKEGVPNVVPKGSLGVLDDDHLVFADLYSRKTRINLRENAHVAIAVVNPAAYEGYQFKGTAEILESGPAFEKAVELVDSVRMDPSKVRYAVIIKVEEIFDLSPGPDSGKRIG
jgi:hypothetical protein